MIMPQSPDGRVFCWHISMPPEYPLFQDRVIPRLFHPDSDLRQGGQGCRLPCLAVNGCMDARRTDKG